MCPESCFHVLTMVITRKCVQDKDENAAVLSFSWIFTVFHPSPLHCMSTFVLACNTVLSSEHLSTSSSCHVGWNGHIHHANPLISITSHQILTCVRIFTLDQLTAYWITPRRYVLRTAFRMVLLLLFDSISHLVVSVSFGRGEMPI